MLFLDTEFTRFRGELISIAIVPDDGNEFYAVRHFNIDDCHPWVIENVLPVLFREKEDDDVLTKRLVNFLNRHRDQPILADWPEDFVHLLNLLCGPNGFSYNVGDLELRLVRGMETEPAVPHNALSDARALRASFYGEVDA